MTNQVQTARFFPLLLILFAASGCSGLIYEIVWFHLLALAIGSTSVSMGFLLATFMAGLCIGSVGLSRIRLGRQHPLRVYAFLELGIAFFGILVLLLIPFIDRIYVSGVGYGMPGMLLRGIICAICLLPPTILMGASLPAIARWVESTPQGVSGWGLLYGINTVGAVFGCLFAGFYLLRIYDTAVGTYVAAAINVAVAVVSFWLASRTPEAALTAESEEKPTPKLAENAWPIYLTIALSGATALGAEVIWTRLMGMMLGATVYVFSIILAVFLTGLAIGSSLGSMVLRSLQPRLALAWCQLLLVLGIAWTAYMIADSIPFWPINPMLASSSWYTFQIDMVRCLWAILPPTILWGASFPLALAAVAAPGEDPGKLVGGIYAANTFGAIVGALGVSLVLVPWIGTQQTQRLLLILSAASSLFILAPHVLKHHSWGTWAGLGIGMIGAGLLARNLDAVPPQLIAYGRKMSITTGSEIIFTAEGRNSSVAIGKWSDGTYEIDVNGHVEATTILFDMKLQRMVGHLPAMLHPNPKSVLGIGFGAGVSAGTFTRYPGIEHITVCEIEPIIPPISTRYFAKQNYSVMLDKRTRIVYDDARHYMLTTNDMFDIIASDPLDVFAKGTAAIYSKEYFESVKRHLNPGGMFTLYVPLYESDMRTVKSELATFFEVFPQGTIWANTREGQGYDMVFMGQDGPLKIDLDQVEQRLQRADYAPVLQSLREIGVPTAIDFLSTYAGQGSDFAPWLKGSEINSDRNLRLQYLAGWGINSSLEDTIYREIMKYRQPPRGVFTGSPDRMQALQFGLAAQ